MQRQNLRRTLNIVLLLCLAILLALATDAAMSLVEHAVYPREFKELIHTYAAEYHIPPSLVFALIKCESDFSSNHVSSDGRIGLMQLSKEDFTRLSETVSGEKVNEGLLYDPETNIKYGTYYLYSLRTQYEDWNAVLSVFLGDTATGKDVTTSARVEKILKTQSKYQKLYNLE